MILIELSLLGSEIDLSIRQLPSGQWSNCTIFATHVTMELSLKNVTMELSFKKKNVTMELPSKKNVTMELLSHTTTNNPFLKILQIFFLFIYFLLRYTDF